MYEDITMEDIPIAQDAFGDQYIYRNGSIYRLNLESGELENLNATLTQFLENIEMNGIEYLSLQQIFELRELGVKLGLCEMMNVYPPFILSCEGKRSYKPIPSQEQIAFLKDFYNQIKNVKDGTVITIELK
ncbi:hypothetical protein [Portibacter marinus]|uniref:hypothetical protein n=1 Tax=Portibacter marinus TaxID=2898660 RepID=UPI001F3344C9|nr:hypothetical protein [Portibacter marinus]